MRRDQMLNIELRGVLKSAVAKLWIVVVALAATLAPTWVHAQDACSSHAVFNSIYDFGDATGDPLNPGFAGAISQGRDGNLWSTAPAGGTMGAGAAFRLTPKGKLTAFDFSSTDGQPHSGLTLGTDGNFYGTTSDGGKYNEGTVFRLTPKGSLTILYSFTGGNDGKAPYAPPIEGTNGDFYGTTNQGGANNLGTIYQITPAGKLTTMYQFVSGEGANPVGALLLGTDGDLYGTTVSGGASNWGAVFKIVPSGNFVFTLLFSFNFSDGGNPYGGLVQGSDGNFYGTANRGGASDRGVVFTVTPKGSFTELYAFSGGSDGAYPSAGLVQATDGNLYGVAYGGGTGYGTIFRITVKGKFTVCEDFNSTKGSGGQVALIEHTNGTLYGDTTQGGDIHNTGVFFYLKLGFKPFVTLLPTSGKVGSTVEILGQGFVTGKTAVSFNGAKATTVTVVSPTYMTAVVPTGATTGFVTVTTPKGTLQSNKKFRVHK
jgi:uncharacterized repeat protein (TIGR03803 family)